MRIRHAETQGEAERLLDDYITQGYRVLSQGERTIKVKKTEYGSLVAHILIFIILGWWNLLIANVLYAVFKYLSGEEVLIKIGEENR